MPMLRVNGTELYYEDTGGRGPAILFSHGLFWDTSLFAPQIAALKSQYRCIAYDHRGQGRSAESDLRAIDMDTLFADAVALIEALDLKPVHVCGLSMGGFIAMRLGARRPDLVRSLLRSIPRPIPSRPRTHPNIACGTGLHAVSEAVASSKRRCRSCSVKARSAIPRATQSATLGAGSCARFADRSGARSTA